MPDRALEDAIRRLATEAATRLTSLVANGDEIPFDVAEDDGEHTFYRYVPLTARFVSEREQELRSLPAFEPARDAVVSAGVAAAYLEVRGQSVAADAGTRAAAALVRFIAELWDGCAEFSLDRTRLERALRELEAETKDSADVELLIAPLAGFRMTQTRLELPNGASIVRSDTIDHPVEAVSSDGIERSAWEPQFLALAEQDSESANPTPAMRQLRELISVLRLFKPGGVELGPHVFAPTGEGKWRRIASGAPSARPGGYTLDEADAEELESFARALEARPDPQGPVAWAIARFELGCERRSPIEALSDHHLALRATLEGEGQVSMSLPVRAAALISEGDDSGANRARMERAFELERAAMTGVNLAKFGEDTGSALELASWLERSVRSILRDAALGASGVDLTVTAEETLIAAGIAAGEGSVGQMGSTDEWDAIPEIADILLEHPQDEPVEEPGEPAEIHVYAGNPGTPAEGEDLEVDDSIEEFTMTSNSRRDWWGETPRNDRETLEWPAAETEVRPGERERVDTPRVRHLFEVPEDADWTVRELDYDRRKSRAS